MAFKTEQTISGSSISIKNYFKDLRKIEQVSGDEQLELARKAQAGDEKARTKLIECNLRFVLTVAKDFQRYNLDVEDLIAEGNIGLIKAINKFDESRGFKFISYAVWWIRQSITQYVYDNGNLVRLPTNKIGMISKVNKVSEQLMHQFDREPTVEEIQAITDFTEDEIKSAYLDVAKCVSFDKKLTEDSEFELIDIIPGETLEDIDGKLNGESLKSEINSVMQELTEREITILNLFFGLNGNPELTLKEIGDKLKLTNERVRQIKEQAIKKMRKYHNSSKLREYIDCKLTC